jgi:hypothetical protein
MQIVKKLYHNLHATEEPSFLLGFIQKLRQALFGKISGTKPASLQSTLRTDTKPGIMRQLSLIFHGKRYSALQEGP